MLFFACSLDLNGFDHGTSSSPSLGTKITTETPSHLSYLFAFLSTDQDTDEGRDEVTISLALLEAVADHNQDEGASSDTTTKAYSGITSSPGKGDLIMYQNILLAYDGSPDGREALAQAKNLASVSGATVGLLAIIDPSENVLIFEGMSFIPDDKRFVTQSVLDTGVRRLQGAGCTATSDVRHGNPAEQIVLFAREMEADLIVVGHRDQGSLARWLNGSVGASILHHAPCSVLVAVKSEQVKNSVTPIRKAQALGEG